MEENTETLYDVHRSLVKALSNATKSGKIKWTLYENVLSPFKDIRDLYESEWKGNSFKLFYNSGTQDSTLIMNDVFVVHNLLYCVDKLHKIIENYSDSELQIKEVKEIIRDISEEY